MAAAASPKSLSPDVIERMDNAVIQHGRYNDRIYLMKWGKDGNSPETLLEKLDRLARRKGYGKIVAKIPKRLLSTFQAWGYRCEAAIPHFYHGNKTGCFAARFYKPKRAQKTETERIEAVMSACRPSSPPRDCHKTGQLAVARCKPEDAEDMCRLFRQVFAHYPFPIQNPSYITSTMRSGFQYVGIKQEGRLIALASLEPDNTHLNGEMGDFATLPEWRGRGLASHLSNYMDGLAYDMGLKTVYAIARARSFGMNRVFAGNGYRHGGLLVNNTRIGEGIESMNVWYKRVDSSFKGRRQKAALIH